MQLEQFLSIHLCPLHSIYENFTESIIRILFRHYAYGNGRWRGFMPEYPGEEQAENYGKYECPEHGFLGGKELFHSLPEKCIHTLHSFNLLPVNFMNTSSRVGSLTTTSFIFPTLDAMVTAFTRSLLGSWE